MINPPSKSHTATDSQFREDLDRILFAMNAAGVGVWELNVTTNEVIWDDRCRELFGLSKDNKIPYAQAIQFIHPDDVAAVHNAVQNALQGIDGGRYEMRYRTIGADDKILRWVHFSGHAYFDDNGRLTRFGGIAQDITAPTIALQQSESKFRTVVESAPAGIAVFMGKELVIDMPNQVFIDILGKGPDITGKPLKEVLPELSNQPFLQILDNVFTTGEAFKSFDTPANILKNGVLTTSYFNIIFSPLRNSNGEVYAILDISLDVTENTKSRKKLEEAQNILQDAVELAQLATWVVDAKSGHVEYSERIKSWLGIEVQGRSVNKGIESLPDDDRELVRKALSWAMDPKSGGVFDLEYGIVNQQNGRRRIVHSQGRTFFDDDGKPLKIIGVSQDITQQRNTRLALESEVQQRTEELDAANEELMATNEELQAINDELAQLNEELERSNENLQHFAHVASHDLKEPVRKIKTFLGLIEADPQTQLSAKTKQLLARVYVASDRIFAMINGVLSYSTTNSSNQPITDINLESILDHVAEDLELIITQKKAVIKYDHFPQFQGAEVLIYQLLLNLISNSLKFSKSDTPPEIDINAEIIQHQSQDFIRLLVKDNGIGFEPEQADKIFNMFSRLHSKDKYEGTGLGLALCKKIVERHRGTIKALSTKGDGALFVILLPKQQPHQII